MKQRRKFKHSFFSFFALFSMVTITLTFTVIIYDAVRKHFGDDTKTIAAIMLLVDFELALLCTTADWIRRKFTVNDSLEQILEATEQITSGNFNVRLTPKHSFRNYDDFDVIMENLNQMAEELSKNETLNMDFVSNVSHEIKTPLAIIRNYSAALQNEMISKEERTSYVKTILQASDRLSALVTNVLKLNKLENQKIVSEMQAVRLDEMLVQTIFSFEESIEEKNIELVCDIDEVSITSSPAHLEIIWNNLLSNAVKFTPVGGKISVSLKKAQNGATVKISDTGIGMSEETGKRIFDKFYQGDGSHSKEGNGLGLALVKKVIDVLGGQISVESELGKGSTFTVTVKEDIL